MLKLKIATRLMLLAAMLFTIGCDRVTKHIAAETMAGGPERTYLGDTLRLAYVENSGGFLGLGADLAPTARTQIFTVGTGVLLLALIAAAFKLPWHPWSLLGIAFFVAGGASNWIDRVVRGSVVDFLNIGIGPLRTGIFNFADVAIMVGFGLIVIGEVWKSESSDQPG